MALRFRFTVEPHWRAAPLAYWVHVPVPGEAGAWRPPAPNHVPHRGYVFLHVEVGKMDLEFSALAQLDHFIDVMDARLLPTSRQLSILRAAPIGPNGHWLSRLPACLKAPRQRQRLVKELRRIRDEIAPLGRSWDAVALRSRT